MILCAVIGATLIVSFFRALILPSENVGAPAIPANYWGFYMAGFAGILLITWAGFLLLALRDPVLARGIGFVTALGLILNAAFGWWWSDPIAALVMTPIIAKEGLNAWQGKACCEPACKNTVCKEK